MSEQLQKIYEDLGRPSAQKLLFAARRKGIQLTELNLESRIQNPESRI